MRLLSYITVLSLLAACGTGDGSAADTTTMTSEETTTSVNRTTTTAFSTSVSLPEGLSGSLLEEIGSDAAQRTGVPMADIEVTSVEAMTFNDAALGCPEPGKMYAQVITPGFIVLIDAGDVELDYRVAEDSDAFRICEGPG